MTRIMWRNLIIQVLSLSLSKIIIFAVFFQKKKKSLFLIFFFLKIIGSVPSDRSSGPQFLREEYFKAESRDRRARK